MFNSYLPLRKLLHVYVPLSSKVTVKSCPISTIFTKLTTVPSGLSLLFVVAVTVTLVVMSLSMTLDQTISDSLESQEIEILSIATQ